jgi:Pyridoxamine 5'-phosphate oxidase
MTSSLPPEVREVFERFITTEYVTVDAHQQPIAWPVTPYYRQGGPTIDLTTGTGYPKKALDARRNPRVGLLFSDPTGSGIESGIRVLVQGTAEVDDKDLAANTARYEREAAEKLPIVLDEKPPRLLARLFTWYSERIYVSVRPERVFVWPDAEAAEPEVHDSHVEEVRSGHSEEPEQLHAAVTGGPTAWDERLEELGGRYPTAVLAWVAPDGFPLAARVEVSSDRPSQTVRIDSPPGGLPLLAGRACLTAHAHAADFSWRVNFQVRGDLSLDDQAGWRLTPRKLVGGLDLPKESRLATVRRGIRYTRRLRPRRKRLLQQRSR